ncbi:MAG TPA: hypothetical protein VLI92_04635, partial [Candidatus Saccharimonadales bacterium]|nr:hypothetical protein [Candidatus Saccharimonadales bacterium]
MPQPQQPMSRPLPPAGASQYPQMPKPTMPLPPVQPSKPGDGIITLGDTPNQGNISTLNQT